MHPIEKQNHKNPPEKKQIGTRNVGTNQSNIRLFRIRKQSTYVIDWKTKKKKNTQGPSKIEESQIWERLENQMEKEKRRRNFGNRTIPSTSTTENQRQTEKERRWEGEISTGGPVYINRKGRASWSTKLPFWDTVGEPITLQSGSDTSWVWEFEDWRHSTFRSKLEINIIYRVDFLTNNWLPRGYTCCVEFNVVAFWSLVIQIWSLQIKSRR